MIETPPCFHVGNAYEFRDMANKYLINSYPKILFFKSGIFMGVFDSVSREPSYIAGQIAKWTKQLPIAVPYRPKEVPTQPATEIIHFKREIDLSYLCEWIPSTLLFQQKKLDQKITDKTLPSIPSVSSFPFSFSCARDSSGRWVGPAIPLSISFPLPSPHIEPFIGSLHGYRTWDAVVFLLSVVYCLVKLVFFLGNSHTAVV